MGDQLPARQMIFDLTSDLLTRGRQLKHLVLNDRIVSLLGKLPILRRFVPQIVGPIHVQALSNRATNSNVSFGPELAPTGPTAPA